MAFYSRLLPGIRPCLVHVLSVWTLLWPLPSHALEADSALTAYGNWVLPNGDRSMATSSDGHSGSPHPNPTLYQPRPDRELGIVQVDYRFSNSPVLSDRPIDFI